MMNIDKIAILKDLVTDSAELSADEFMHNNVDPLGHVGMGAYAANYKTATSNSAKLNMFRSLAIRLRADLDSLLAEQRRANAPIVVKATTVKTDPRITGATRFTKASDMPAIEPPKRGRKPGTKAGKKQLRTDDDLAEFAKLGAALRIPVGEVVLATFVPVPAHKRWDARKAFFKQASRAPATQTGLSEDNVNKLSAEKAKAVLAPKKEDMDGTHPNDPRNVMFRHRNLLASNPVTRRVLEAYEVHKVIGAPVALDMCCRILNQEHQFAMGRAPKKSLSDHNPHLSFDHRPCNRQVLPGVPNEEDRIRRAIEGMRLAAIAAGEIATFVPKRSGGTYENRWAPIERPAKAEHVREDVVHYAVKESKADSRANKLLGAVADPKVKMRQIPKGI